MTKDHNITSSHQDLSINDLSMMCSLVLLFLTLIVWAIVLVVSLEEGGLSSFNLESEETVCTVTSASLVNTTCIWGKNHTGNVYECAVATVVFQVDHTQAHITIKDTDFPYPLIGDDSHTRMTQHVAENYPNASNRTCWIRGDEVRFKVFVHNPLISYILLPTDAVLLLVLLCAVTRNRRSDVTLEEESQATPEALEHIIEIPHTTSED